MRYIKDDGYKPEGELQQAVSVKEYTGVLEKMAYIAERVVYEPSLYAVSDRGLEQKAFEDSGQDIHESKKGHTETDLPHNARMDRDRNMARGKIIISGLGYLFCFCNAGFILHSVVGEEL